MEIIKKDPPPRILIQGSGGGEIMDRYTAGIELSNACRSFYVSRLKAANCLKQKLGMQDRGCPQQQDLGVTGRTGGPLGSTDDDGIPLQLHGRTCTSIDRNMTFLRRELASLVEQDLALMRQLLTLNDQIEELKWQRKLSGFSRVSLEDSSYKLDGSESEFTMTDTECESNDGLNVKSADLFPAKYPSPSSLSIYDECYDSRADGLDDELCAASKDSTTTALMSTANGKHRSSTSDFGSSDELGTSSPDMSVAIGYVLQHGEDSSAKRSTVVRNTRLEEVGSPSERDNKNKGKDQLQLQRLEHKVSTDSGFVQVEFTDGITV